MNKPFNNVKMKRNLLLSIILASSILWSFGVVCAEIDDYVLPSNNLGTCSIGNQIRLEFSATFIDSNSSLVIIVIDQIPDGFEFVDYTAFMDDADVTDQFSNLIINEAFYFNCSSIIPHNGNLTLTLNFQAVEVGDYLFHWRSIFTCFKEPPDPPSFVDVTGESSIKVTGIPTNRYKITLLVDGIEDASTKVYLDEQLYENMIESNNPLNLYMDKDIYPIIKVNKYVNSTKAIRYICKDNSWTPTISIDQNHKYIYSPQYRVNVEAQYGEIDIHLESNDGFYDAGLTIQLNAVIEDKDKYEWQGWIGKGKGSYTGKENPVNVKINNPINMTAIWLPKEDVFTKKIVVEEDDVILDFPELNTYLRIDAIGILEVKAFEHKITEIFDTGIPDGNIKKIIDVSVSDKDSVKWPVYIEIHYSDADVEKLDEKRLRMYYYKNGTWTICSNTNVNVEENFVWSELSEEELWGSPLLIGELSMVPKININDFVVQPQSVNKNGLVYITLSLFNYGAKEHVYYEIFLDEKVIDGIDVMLGEGESKEITITYNVTDNIGRHTISVSNFTELIEVREYTGSPNFVFESIRLSSTKVTPGENLTVTVIVRNVGDGGGTIKFTLYVDDIENEMKGAFIDKGETANIEFHVKGEMVGEHILQAGTLRNVFVVEKPSIDYHKYLLIGGAALALVIVIIILRNQNII